MLTVARMRPFNKNIRIYADSLTEIKRGLARAAERVTDEGERYAGHVVKPGNLLNALVVWFLKLPPDEQGRIAREGLASLQAVQDSDPAPIVPSVASSAPRELGTARGGHRIKRPGVES
jgi:hypothetical protein